MAKRKRYGVYARNSSPLITGSLSACLRFIAACMGGYSELRIVEIAS
jgi:hypothetical protein